MEIFAKFVGKGRTRILAPQRSRFTTRTLIVRADVRP
jgi:hypothetical protein